MEMLQELREKFNTSEKEKEESRIQLAVNKIRDRYDQRIIKKNHKRVMYIEVNKIGDLVEVKYSPGESVPWQEAEAGVLVDRSDVSVDVVKYIKDIYDIFDKEEGYSAEYNEYTRRVKIEILP